MNKLILSLMAIVVLLLSGVSKAEASEPIKNTTTSKDKVLIEAYDGMIKEAISLNGFFLKTMALTLEEKEEHLSDVLSGSSLHGLTASEAEEMRQAWHGFLANLEEFSSQPDAARRIQAYENYCYLDCVYAVTTCPGTYLVSPLRTTMKCLMPYITCLAGCAAQYLAG